MKPLRILVVSSEWPDAANPTSGIFVWEQVNALRRRGIIVDVLPFRGRGRPIRYAQTACRLRGQLAKCKYDLVHAHFGQAGYVATLQKVAPTIVTFHGSDVFGVPGRSLRERLTSMALKAVSRQAVLRCNAAIAVSAAIKAQIRRSDAWVVPMGIDLELFCPGSKTAARDALNWDQKAEIVLFVGNPKNPTKRFDLAHRVVEIARDRRTLLTMRVCWGVPRELVPLYYRAADLLLVTSDHEGGPISVYEALATDLPVVSVEVGSARERLAGLAGSAIVASGSPTDLAAAVCHCLLQRDSFSGRQRVAELDHSAIAERLERIYCQTVS